MIDYDKLARICQQFEHDESERNGNPFDMDAAFDDPRFMAIVSAFTDSAAKDTPQFEPAEEYHGALVVAGFLQGLFIGYQYASESDN